MSARIPVPTPCGGAMKRAPYPTDLTDAAWSVLAPLLPPAKGGGRPRDVDLREILNAAFYKHDGGCSWRLLPHDLPPWQTVYTYVRAWMRDGTWERLLAARAAAGTFTSGSDAGSVVALAAPEPTRA